MRIPIKPMLVAVLIAGTLVFSALTLPEAVAQSTASKERVVLQVSEGDPKNWNLALNNANNIAKDLGADAVEIEIVVYGPGIDMLKADSPVATRVGQATSSGVRVVACQNTMRARKLTEADMNMAVGYVPSGVVELVKRQREGWAYIRP